MPTPISGHTASTYPVALDTFSRVIDGLSSPSVFSATPWNTLRHGLYKTEQHLQKIARSPGGITVGDRRVVTITGSITVGATGATSTGTTFSLSNAQVSFLNSQPFSANNMLRGSARLNSGGDAYQAWAKPIPASNQVTLTVKHADPSTALTTGTYWVSLTIVGL